MKIQIKMSNEENKKVNLVKVTKEFKTKAEAIKYMIREYKDVD